MTSAWLWLRDNTGDFRVILPSRCCLFEEAFWEQYRVSFVVQGDGRTQWVSTSVLSARGSSYFKLNLPLPTHFPPFLTPNCMNRLFSVWFMNPCSWRHISPLVTRLVFCYLTSIRSRYNFLKDVKKSNYKHNIEYGMLKSLGTNNK